MALTQNIIKNTPSPEKGRIVLTDDRGLQLRISSRKRAWSLQYRFEGRMLKFTLGEWPAVSLQEARKLADAARLQVAKGENPQAQKAEARGNKTSFVAAWEEFDKQRFSEFKDKTVKEYRRSAKADILPHFKSMALKDVTKSDVVSLISRLGKRAPVLGNRTLALLHSFFKWCVDMDMLQSNPAKGIPKPKKKEIPRDRILSLSELRRLYEAADGLSAGNQLFLKLMLLTGQREGVISGLMRSEICGDYLVVERSRNKSGVRIHVPLSTEAQNLLQRLGSTEGAFVVSTTSGLKPISGYSKLKLKIDKLAGLEEAWRFHDIRRGITTFMEETGVSRSITAKVLNHKDQSVTGIYARPELRGRVRMVLERWAEILTSNEDLNHDSNIEWFR